MEPFKELLEKQMSRQDFLKHAGLALMSVFGAGNMLSYMLAEMNRIEMSGRTATTIQGAGQGFGSGKFGV